MFVPQGGKHTVKEDMPEGQQSPAESGSNPVTQFQSSLKTEEIKESLRNIKDPEIGQNIVDLGLVYDVSYDEREQYAHVKMTLTSPMCPYGPMILNQVPIVAQSVAGVKEADVEVVWTPPWDPHTMASEDVKMELGIW